MAGVTAIHPPGRYGAHNMEDAVVQSFQEKPAGDGAWINGGFFVLEPDVFDIIDGDQTSWEWQPRRDDRGHKSLDSASSIQATC